MISDMKIQENKDRFLKLVASIERKNANLEGLLNWLQSSDFFLAPASAKYHAAYKGGLCQHSLNVYDNLCALVHDFGMEEIISEDTCKIVGLLHDMAKINFYKLDYRNKKIYSETGSKRDEQGRFDWVSVKEYVSRDDTERFIYGNHETTSEYYIRSFIPLTHIESIAIIHHHGNMSWDSMQDNIGTIWNAYPLATLIYMADVEAAFINENTNGNVFVRVKKDEQINLEPVGETENTEQTSV